MHSAANARWRLSAAADVLLRTSPLLMVCAVWFSLNGESACRLVVGGPLLNHAIKRLPWPESWSRRPRNGHSCLWGTRYDYGSGWLPGRYPTLGLPSGHAHTAVFAAVLLGSPVWWLVAVLVCLQRVLGHSHTVWQVCVGAAVGMLASSNATTNPIVGAPPAALAAQGVVLLWCGCDDGTLRHWLTVFVNP